MAKKPKLPQTINYYPTEGGACWTVQHFDWLADEFWLTEAITPKFHLFAEKFSIAWKAIRRLCGVNPIIVSVDTDAKYLRIASMKELAAESGTTPEQIAAEIQTFKMAWDKYTRDDPHRLSASDDEPAPKAGKKPKKQNEPEPEPAASDDIGGDGPDEPQGDELPPEDPELADIPELPPAEITLPEPMPVRKPATSRRRGRERDRHEEEEPSDYQREKLSIPPLENAQEAALLRRYGLLDDLFSACSTVDEAVEERCWALEKVKDYKQLLDEPSVASMVKQAIISEILINRINREMLSIDIASLRFAQLQETKKTIEKGYLDSWKQIVSIVPYAEQASNRVNVAGTISDMLKAVQEYRSKKSNRLICGIYSAYGVQIRLRESVQAPIRFRLGQTVAIAEAMTPDALWNPDWQRSFTDAQCKILDEGFREGAKRMREQLNLPVPDLESEDPKHGEYPPLFVPPDADEPTETLAIKEAAVPVPTPTPPAPPAV